MTDICNDVIYYYGHVALTPSTCDIPEEKYTQTEIPNPAFELCFCRNNLIAKWLVQSEKLYLIEVDDNHILNEHPPILANWFSGRIVIFVGEVIEREFYSTTYEKDLCLIIKNGEIVDRYIQSNHVHNYQLRNRNLTSSQVKISKDESIIIVKEDALTKKNKIRGKARVDDSEDEIKRIYNKYHLRKNKLRNDRYKSILDEFKDDYNSWSKCDYKFIDNKLYEYSLKNNTLNEYPSFCENFSGVLIYHVGDTSSDLFPKDTVCSKYVKVIVRNGEIKDIEYDVAITRLSIYCSSYVGAFRIMPMAGTYFNILENCFSIRVFKSNMLDRLLGIEKKEAKKSTYQPVLKKHDENWQYFGRDKSLAQLAAKVIAYTLNKSVEIREPDDEYDEWRICAKLKFNTALFILRLNELPPRNAPSWWNDAFLYANQTPKFNAADAALDASKLKIFRDPGNSPQVVSQYNAYAKEILSKLLLDYSLKFSESVYEDDFVIEDEDGEYKLLQEQFAEVREAWGRSEKDGWFYADEDRNSENESDEF